MGDGDGTIFKQWQEILFEIDVLARAHRRIHRVGQTLPLIGKLPRDHVLVPGQTELIQGLAQADAGFDADMAKVVDGQGDFISDHLAHLRDILAEDIDAFVRDLNTGELVHDVIGTQHARRRDQRVFHPFEQTDADIHLEKAEAVIHTLFEQHTHLLAVAPRRRIAVAEDLVAELAAGQLVGR